MVHIAKEWNKKDLLTPKGDNDQSLKDLFFLAFYFYFFN